MSEELPAPDLSLIRPDSREIGQPHLEHFHAGNKELYYIGTRHGKDFQNLSHEIIHQAAKKYRPQLIIVEGLETAKGLSPISSQLIADPEKRSEILSRTEENIHVAMAARLNNIPFVGGEPTNEAIFKNLEGKGYSTKEIMALYLVIQIPVWKRKGQFNEANFEAQANDFFLNAACFNHIPKASKLSFDEFKTLYEAHKAEMGNKDFSRLAESDWAGNDSPDANYWQKMGSAENALREKHLDTLIANSLEKYDKVMVVYGNAHLYRSAPVFEKMFGNKVKFERLVLEEDSPKTKHSATPASIPGQSRKLLWPKLLKYSGYVLLIAAAVAAGASGVLSAASLILAAGAVIAIAGSELTDFRSAPSSISHRSVPTGAALLPVTMSMPVAHSPVASRNSGTWVQMTRPPVNAPVKSMQI